MAKYRKTALIEASQWHKMGDHPAVVELPEHVVARLTGPTGDLGWVETLEGGQIVQPGYWIATGAKGEHWPIHPDAFAATYERADEGA